MKLHTNNKQATRLRRAMKIFLPISIFSLLVSYIYSSTIYYLHSVTSFLQILNQFTTKKAMFLLSNIIILFLTCNSLHINKKNDEEKVHKCLDTEQEQGVSLHHELESNDEVIKQEDPNFIKHIYVDLNELILIECNDPPQDVYFDSDNEVHELGIVDEKGVIEESIEYVQCCSKCKEMIDVHHKLEKKVVEEKEKDKGKTCMELVVVEVEKFMEVMVMETDLKVAETSIEVMVKESELDCLELDDLNRRFDEFIEREKKKRQMENLQIVLIKNIVEQGRDYITGFLDEGGHRRSVSELADYRNNSDPEEILSLHKLEIYSRVNQEWPKDNYYKSKLNNNMYPLFDWNKGEGSNNRNFNPKATNSASINKFVDNHRDNRSDLERIESNKKIIASDLKNNSSNK